MHGQEEPERNLYANLSLNNIPCPILKAMDNDRKYCDDLNGVETTENENDSD